MAKAKKELEGQLTFDLDALMVAKEETDESFGEEEMVYCANLGCNDWNCLRHNRNAPWGEICNFKQFSGGKGCKGRMVKDIWRERVEE